MAPNTSSPVPPGANEVPISPLRDNERPVWSRNGTLVRRPPVRHYIPKHPFYYTSTELFDTQGKTKAAYEQDTMKFAAANSAGADARRAFSAPVSRNSPNFPKIAKPEHQQQSTPPRAKTSRTRGSTTFVRPEAVAWVSTPVPGIRTVEQYDLYRRAALDQKNTNVYHIQSGLLPKYMGYVPGLKFRYGSPFGMLTYNAKEVGVERSATWGGAVSLF